MSGEGSLMTYAGRDSGGLTAAVVVVEELNMHMYRCDGILDVCAKHPFVATFCRRAGGRTQKHEKRRQKQRETNEEGKKKRSMLVNNKNQSKTKLWPHLFVPMTR